MAHCVGTAIIIFRKIIAVDKIILFIYLTNEANELLDVLAECRLGQYIDIII